MLCGVFLSVISAHILRLHCHSGIFYGPSKAALRAPLLYPPLPFLSVQTLPFQMVPGPLTHQPNISLTSLSSFESAT